MQREAARHVEVREAVQAVVRRRQPALLQARTPADVDVSQPLQALADAREVGAADEAVGEVESCHRRAVRGERGQGARVHVRAGRVEARQQRARGGEPGEVGVEDECAAVAGRPADGERAETRQVGGQVGDAVPVGEQAERVAHVEVRQREAVATRQRNERAARHQATPADGEARERRQVALQDGQRAVRDEHAAGEDHLAERRLAQRHVVHELVGRLHTAGEVEATEARRAGQRATHHARAEAVRVDGQPLAAPHGDRLEKQVEAPARALEGDQGVVLREELNDV